MYPKCLKSYSDDKLYLIRNHFFEIERINISSENFTASELYLKNHIRKMKIDFLYDLPDLIFTRLFYPFLQQGYDADFQKLTGKILKLEFEKRDSDLELENISFYQTTFKDVQPLIYKELVGFSSEHLCWVLQGLSKHDGLPADIIEFLNHVRDIDFNSIFLLNKSLSSDLLAKNKNRIRLNEEFLAQNQSTSLWNKQILDLMFEPYENPFDLYDSAYDKIPKLKKLLSENREIIQNDVLLLEKKSYFDWSIISANEEVNWTFNKILVLQDCLIWRVLSANPSLPWNKELIEFFYEKWDWKNLSTNNGINWSASLINAFHHTKECKHPVYHVFS